ncbi:RNA polymerase sigma-70 factor, ECF subfamily [Brevibacterium aurantiacum]|uniref:RNA polymerase sigma-70 factor, ECF subfamily n=2 Tax=Brevibacterium aurantiacum TaxID=273384 RepID=A0A2H1HMZ3_BREAU|nr:RNA polymerase sigma-70 factor, ECF subfamily [Brevibacterium aurantiacum]
MWSVLPTVQTAVIDEPHARFQKNSPVLAEWTFCGVECVLTTGVVAYDVDMTGHDDRFDIVTLVVRAREGDIDAFESLVDRYETKLLRFCLRTLGDRQDAEDVVQDTLVQAWKSMNTLSEPAAFGTWIYRLASNKCTDMLRRRMARPSDAQDPDDMRIHADNRVSVEKSVEARTALEHFSEVLQTLSSQQRVTWVLHQMEGLSYAEVATTLGVSEGSVRGRIHRARAALVEGMEGWT